MSRREKMKKRFQRCARKSKRKKNRRQRYCRRQDDGLNLPEHETTDKLSPTSNGIQQWISWQWSKIRSVVSHGRQKQQNQSAKPREQAANVTSQSEIQQLHSLLRQQKVAHQAKRREKDDELARAMSTIEGKDDELARAMSTIEEKDDELARTKSAVEEKDDELARAMFTIKEKEEELTRAMSIVEEKDRQLALALSVVEERDEQLGHAMCRNKEKDERLAQIVSSVEERDTQLTQVYERLSNTQTALEYSMAECEAMRRQSDSDDAESEDAERMCEHSDSDKETSQVILKTQLTEQLRVKIRGERDIAKTRRALYALNLGDGKTPREGYEAEHWCENSCRSVSRTTDVLSPVSTDVSGGTDVDSRVRQQWKDVAVSGELCAPAAVQNRI